MHLGRDPVDDEQHRIAVGVGQPDGFRHQIHDLLSRRRRQHDQTVVAEAGVIGYAK